MFVFFKYIVVNDYDGECFGRFFWFEIDGVFCFFIVFVSFSSVVFCLEVYENCVIWIIVSVWNVYKYIVIVFFDNVVDRIKINFDYLWVFVFDIL